MASKERWQEEEELLHEELRRVGATFRYEEAKWLELGSWTGWPGENTTHSTIAGVRAYAHRQANVYRTLAVDAETRFEMTMATGLPAKPKKAIMAAT